MPPNSRVELPEFLRTYSDFLSHLDEHFDDLDNQGRGNVFLGFALRLLPLIDEWAGFELPTPSEKKTHDGGVDFSAKNNATGAVLVGQSKYKIRKVDDFDNVLSKFAAYEAQETRSPKGTQEHLPITGFTKTKPNLIYLIVTSSKLDTIRHKYEQTSLPSRGFYDSLVERGALQIIDGPRILEHVQALYRRSYVVPTELDLELILPPVTIDGVYLSAVSALVLRQLYEKHGESLFFENVRDFLGSGSTSDNADSVNAEITQTLTVCPEKMLGRNNGVTFRADEVVVAASGSLSVLRLRNCGIVNGCQTTMCIVHVGEKADSAKIPVKVVVTDNSWDIAKAANYQNRVTRVDLELARFLRPQLVRKAASEFGFGVEHDPDETAATVLEAIYQDRIFYEEVRLLVLGLFSRHPNNLFSYNYSEVRVDILDAIHNQGRTEHVLRVLFALLVQMRRSIDKVRILLSAEEYADLLKRFFREDNFKYRCFLAILAACGATNDPLGNKPTETDTASARSFDFIAHLESLLTKHAEYYDRVFFVSFQIVAEKALDVSSEGRDADILQKMYKEISGANFQNLFRLLRLRMKGDAEIERLGLSLRPSESTPR
jgi:hypothetical protein